MANYGTIPNNHFVGALQFVRRNAADTAWESYDTFSAQDGALKADLVGGKVPSSQIPAVALVTPQVAASQVAMLALTTQEGDVVIRTDESKTYIRNTGTSGTITDFTAMVSPTDQVSSVNGLQGVVVLGKGDIGLGNVDNTTDATKPVSAPQQTALDGKLNNPTGLTSQYVRGDGTLATLPTPAVRSFSNTPGRSIVTGTGATGFQVSATRDAFVTASVGIVTTASIGSGQDGYIVMEIAPTNSATPSDWVEIGRARNGQVYTLAIALQGVQTIAGDIARMVPAGYFVKYRAVNVTGTPTNSWVSGQEVLL